MENSAQEKDNHSSNGDKNDDSNNNTNKVIESNIILNSSEVEKNSKLDLLREYYTSLQKQKYERFIEIIMNQTTYTKEEAISSLEKHKGDITLVIKDFLGVVDKSEEREKEKNSKSLHQKKYSIIREYMDNASVNFTKKQEEAKKYNEFIEKQQKAREAREAHEAQLNKK
jgi:NACalpha-BTF3-like transcription factor